MSETITNGAAIAAASISTLDPLVPSKVFAGKRFVVVGGTGFLGKVWVSMLLHRFPDIAHLYLLVRPKEGQTAEERFWAQIATSPVFDPLRERYSGPAFEAFLREKITPVGGDVVEPLLGIDDKLVQSLRGKIGAVVNVAGVVDFNPPLDEALEVNAFGVNNLCQLAKTLGAPVMHTSTCYVAGYRAGLIEEDDPREVPFPRAEEGTWYGAVTPGRILEKSHWDPQREIEECLDLVKQARHRADDAFRQSAFLDQAKENLENRGEPARGAPLKDELAKVKRKFVENQLTEAGTERARFWGWTNIYTYTKSIGEQALAASGVPFCIVRPAVIESSCVYPFAGWNEGINTSAPYLYMASKGLVQFPADRDIRLDIIPVDMVTSGMIASLAELVDGTQKAVYQYGTTDTNGCRMPRYMELAGLYKRRQVHEGKRTKLFDIVSSRFESLGVTKKQYEAHGTRRIAGVIKGVGGLLDKAGVGPVRPLFKPAAAALKAMAKTEEKTADILEIFMPFVAEVDWVFSCANTRYAIDRMPPEERALFFWEPEKIDWRQWMWEIHLPGLEKWVYPLIEEKQQRELKPLRSYETLLDILDEMADRHDHAVALGRFEKEGLSRTSYREWRESANATAARLAALGVKPGDRVVISGENQPAWPLGYFGILRAGAVAVPVDPALEPAQLTNIIRSSGAKVALWDRTVEEKGGRGAREASPGLETFDLVDFTDGGGRGAPDSDLRVPDFKAKPTDVASVIYTSGTTGEPKGVMLSHGNFTALLAAIAPIFPLKESDRVLSVLPLHHTFEFTCGLLLPLSRGARILYLDELTAERLGEGLKKGRVTAMVGVPALWQMLERRIQARVKEQGPAAAMAFNWSLELNRMLGKRLGVNAGRLFFGSVHEALGGSTRFLISGGAALPKDTAELFQGLGLPLAEGYGLTEAAPVLTVAPASVKNKAGNVGKAVPGVQIKIDKPDERGVGEVLARGPNIMLGYADNPEATKAVLDEGGWLRTGDLGKLDDKKRLTIVGRQKEVIVSANGENVYPDDVETMLGSIKGVKELGIVGIDDGRGGERVACLAVPEGVKDDDGPQPSRAERHERALHNLREAFQKLPKFCQPAVVHLYDADLPRTATRKVKRKEVKEILGRLVSATEVPASASGSSESSPIRHAVAAIAHKKPGEITAATRFKADLGFDSLMAMELAVAIESQLGRALDANRLQACETVGEVEQLAAEGRVLELTPRIEEKEDEPLVLPEPIADAAKKVLGAAQMGFYDKLMKPRAFGRAFIPHNRNTIVVSNHSSHLDMGFVKWALGAYGEDMVTLAAQDYFFEKSRIHKAYFENLTNVAAFDRKGGLRGALRQAGEFLETGRTVLLFPEGTRSTDGAIHEFKPVVGHLALVHGVDILPIYLGGTRESWPKGGKVPTRRDITARIGPPLEVKELERLTKGMKLNQASRKVAELTRLAVVTLRDGGVLDLRKLESLDGPAAAPKEHPLVGVFRELETKYVAGRVAQPITFYFTLGAETEAKWTLTISPQACEAKIGKPPGSQADCVLKTTPEIFMKIVREAYTPSPMEFMTGLVKSNDISLLQTFQKVFDLA